MKELPEQAASLHMSTVIVWSNSMIMVFDDQGRQMPAYQGRMREKAPLIAAVFRGAWSYGDWDLGVVFDGIENRAFRWERTS